MKSAIYGFAAAIAIAAPALANPDNEAPVVGAQQQQEKKLPAQIERGRYFAITMSCNDCHSPLWLLKGGKTDEQKTWLTGDNVGWYDPRFGTTYPPNLRLLAAIVTAETFMGACALRKAAPANAMVPGAAHQRPGSEGHLRLYPPPRRGRRSCTVGVAPRPAPADLVLPAAQLPAAEDGVGTVHRGIGGLLGSCIPCAPAAGCGRDLAEALPRRGERVDITGRELARAGDVAQSIGPNVSAVAPDLIRPPGNRQQLTEVGPAGRFVLAAIERATLLVTLKPVG